MRLDEARRRLENPQEPIAEIARRTGFSSPAYLSSVFRAATGLTPRDYRKSRTSGRGDGRVPHSPQDVRRGGS